MVLWVGWVTEEGDAGSVAVDLHFHLLVLFIFFGVCVMGMGMGGEYYLRTVGGERMEGRSGEKRRRRPERKETHTDMQKLTYLQSIEWIACDHADDARNQARCKPKEILFVVHH